MRAPPCSAWTLTRFVLVLSIAARPALARADPPRLLALPRGEAALTIDGALDEPAWAQAEPGTGFVERTPHPGAAPPVPTSVRVLYDRGALYVGVELGLAEGETPRALCMTRDSDAIWNDDAVSVKIDARQDHRTTLGFVVSASGAQLDYLVLDNGRAFRREFDMVWESAVRIESTRWTAEFRIPSTALGLSADAGERALGLNVSRDHNRFASTYDWSPMPPEFGPFSALHYGVVDGVHIGGGGTPIAVTPYSLGELVVSETTPPTERLRGRAGGEVLARLDADVWAEATLQPDFAQVDLDDALVNLDRFPLFYPERRPFFLNGLDAFDAGVPETLVPFYSRRIGLDARGRSVPVLGGVKLYGRQGPLSFGVLDVLTDETDGQPAANVVASRARVGLGSGASYVGAFLVSRQPFRWDGSAPQDGQALHATVGADGLVRTAGDRLEIYAFAAGTARDGGEGAASGEGVAAATTARWRGREWQPSLTGLWVERSFAPDVGFARRPGAARLALESPFVARPSGALRALVLSPGGEVQADDGLDQLLFLRGSLTASVEGTGGWFASFVGRYVEDTVAQDFEVVPGVTALAGTYRGVQIDVLAATPTAWNPTLSVSYRVSNAYFGGVLHNPYARFVANLGAWVFLDLRADVYRVELRQAPAFWTYGLNALVRVTPTTAVQVDLVGRLDGENRRAVGMARLRYRYAPGSDFFLVWRTDAAYPDGMPTSFSHQLTLKMSARFDLRL